MKRDLKFSRFAYFGSIKNCKMCGFVPVVSWLAINSFVISEPAILSLASSISQCLLPSAAM